MSRTCCHHYPGGIVRCVWSCRPDIRNRRAAGVGPHTPITSRRCAAGDAGCGPGRAKLRALRGAMETTTSKGTGARAPQLGRTPIRPPGDAYSRRAALRHEVARARQRAGQFQSRRRRLGAVSLRGLFNPDPIEHAAVLGAIKAKPCGGRTTRPALTAPARGGCDMGGRGGRTPAARSNKRTDLGRFPRALLVIKKCLSISSVCARSSTGSAADA